MQLVVGQISRPHGVRGELAVEVRTDDPELRLAVGAVLRTEPAAAGPLTVTATRSHAGRLLVRFAGVDDRTAAEELRGTLLMVESDELEDLRDPNEFRDHQLIGLLVVGPGGDQVGTVADVLHHGQDLLVVDGSGGRAGAEILIPFVSAIVSEVDLAAGLVRVDPPPGLLDPEAAI
ncbi:MAG: ribosome maturation factor RimM [Actinobacteria bacterium]|nr:ribosome maturation factor RimM [Actinomycetota bacterium]MBO0837444.1 ribosome maturation factor RimM [Actinomycetota bacterium]